MATARDSRFYRQRAKDNLAASNPVDVSEIVWGLLEQSGSIERGREAARKKGKLGTRAMLAEAIKDFLEGAAKGEPVNANIPSRRDERPRTNERRWRP